MKSLRLYILLLLWLGITNTTLCQDDVIALDSVVVSNHYYDAPVRGTLSNNVYMNIRSLESLPQLLGPTDPLRTTQFLPGVQTNSEGDAGIHIQGCNNSQNAVMLDGVVVYNPMHMFGLFSVFNANHFDAMSLYYNTNHFQTENRIGGVVNLQGSRDGKDLTDSIHADVTVGLLSAQSTLRIPIKKKVEVVLSGRLSYMNLLYGPWLKVDDNQLKYDLYDYNVTLRYHIDKKRTLWCDFYSGQDQLSLPDTEDFIALKWGNQVGAFHYDYENGRKNVKVQNTLFLTKSKSDVEADYLNYGLELPADIEDFGYKFMGKFNAVEASLFYTNHLITPQHPNVESATGNVYTPIERRHSQELSGSLSYTTGIGRIPLYVTLGSKASMFYDRDSKRTIKNVDPFVEGRYEFRDYSKITVSYSHQHQYLHQVGFSSLGMPTEFWTPSCEYMSPQYSRAISLSYDGELFKGMIYLTASIYYKRIGSQYEYVGNLYDMFYTKDYCLEDNVKEARGYNYGLNIMLSKRAGRIRGWLSYSFGRSMRHFLGDEKMFPSSYERPHELNAVAMYTLSRKLSLNGTLVVASGTPFTAPKYFYIMNDRVLSEYSDYNSNRLPWYKRLDVSLHYDISKKHSRITQSLLFSIYNISFSDNAVYQRLRIRKSDGAYGYRGLSYIPFPLPSVSYNVKF